MNAILNQFITRVQTAAKSRSKNVSLTIDEAQSIVAEITKLVSRDSSILDQINTIINTSQTARFAKADIPTSDSDIVILSGGKFTDEQNQN
ncbi:MAG: hypothetical protein M0R77_02865 [Gammaproteobacteria bacterium]|nr:hypothetical protein [Gammaproteobacteria bacterium]